MTSKQALSKYGDPFLLQTQQKTMSTWQVPSKLLDAFAHVRFSAVGTIGFPKKIFCNNDFKPLLEKALNNVVDRGLAKEMKTWDGCFVIRNKRGLSSLSMHSWGLAVDINAFENQLNQKPNISPQFVKCFTDAGLEWGGNWKRLDAMHYEMK
jgi:hypothetical protein